MDGIYTEQIMEMMYMRTHYPAANKWQEKLDIEYRKQKNDRLFDNTIWKNKHISTEIISRIYKVL